MVNPYARQLSAITKRGLLKKVNEAHTNGYSLVGDIKRHPLAWRKWKATMTMNRLPDTSTTRAVDGFLRDPSVGVRRFRPAA